MKCYSFLALVVLFLLFQLLFSRLLRLGRRPRLRCPHCSRSFLGLQQLRDRLATVHLEEGKIVAVLSFLEPWDLHPVVALDSGFHFLLGFFFSWDLFLLRFLFGLRVVESLGQLEGLLLLEHHDELFLGEGGQVEGLGLGFCLGHGWLLRLRTLALGDLLGLLAASLIDLFTLRDLLSREAASEVAKKMLHLVGFVLCGILALLCDILLALELLLHVAH